MIVKGKPNTDLNQESILFGSYALVYPGTSNDTNRRSIPPALSNDNRGHYSMILYTGDILHRYKWTELHIDSNVIEQVNNLSSDYKHLRQSIISSPLIHFNNSVLCLKARYNISV